MKPVQTAFPIGLAFRAGIVIAATPTTTQARPIQAVELNCSPRKTTPTELPNDLEPMLTRLKLTAIRDQLVRCWTKPAARS